MKKVRQSLRQFPSSHGHVKVSCEIDGTQYSTITNNMRAVDAAFDEDYKGEGRFYESREAAQDALIDEIKKENDL